MEAFDGQCIRLEALNGFLEDLAGDPNFPTWRSGGNDSHTPVKELGASEGSKTDVS